MFGQSTWAAWRGLKGFHNRKTIQCKSITNSKKKRLCLDSVNAKLYQKQLKIIRKVITKDCNQNKNPGLCKKKGKKAIRQVATKLIRLLQKSKKRRLKGLYRY